MQKLLPLLTLALSGCSVTVSTPQTALFDACRPDCDDLGSLIETRTCLFLPSGERQINDLFDRLSEDADQMRMPADSCGCLLATFDANGSISDVEIIGTNAPEVAAFVAHSIKNLPPTKHKADCLAGMKVAVMWPTTSSVARDVRVGSEAIVSGDYALALRVLRPFAEAGDPHAEFLLGNLYERGYGLLQDYQEAMRWYALAAESDHPSAQYNIGNMYANGLGVAQDYEKAMDWYRLAADNGNASAQSSIGYMYANGWSVAQDHEKAAIWYRLAARQGDGIAQYNLGVSYYDGKGVARDFESAHMYFSLALAHCDASSVCHEKAEHALDQVTEEMTKDEIQKAKTMAANWWAATPN